MDYQAFTLIRKTAKPLNLTTDPLIRVDYIIMCKKKE